MLVFAWHLIQRQRYFVSQSRRSMSCTLLGASYPFAYSIVKRLHNFASQGRKAEKLSKETGMQLVGVDHMKLMHCQAANVKCLVAWGHNTLLLAFRGTANFTNAIADIKVLLPALLISLLVFPAVLHCSDSLLVFTALLPCSSLCSLHNVLYTCSAGIKILLSSLLFSPSSDRGLISFGAGQPASGLEHCQCHKCPY